MSDNAYRLDHEAVARRIRGLLSQRDRDEPEEIALRLGELFANPHEWTEGMDTLSAASPLMEAFDTAGHRRISELFARVKIAWSTIFVSRSRLRSANRRFEPSDYLLDRLAATAQHHCEHADCILERRHARRVAERVNEESLDNLFQYGHVVARRTCFSRVIFVARSLCEATHASGHAFTVAREFLHP